MVEDPNGGPMSPGHAADTHALVNRLRRIVTDAARLSPEEGGHKLEEASLAIARLIRS